MTRRADPYEIAGRAMQPSIDRGLGMNLAEDDRLDGRHVTFRGTSFLNFTSCSYLALEHDRRLHDGAIDALARYGTQMSCSRHYVSAPPYAELEPMLDQMFGGPTLPTSSTTLGHFSTLPLVVGRDDAVILDHQVHESVQMATSLVKATGTHVELVRHSRMDRLEERITTLSARHARVWYMCDGIYSMLGDPAPTRQLGLLLSRYPNLHLYVDDAHATSWCGRHGRGSVLDALPTRERTIVAFSLNKAFAAAGGVFVFPDEALRDRVRLCGGPVRFSGPIQPPMLGAAVASARIHLSPEIEKMQIELQERIRYFNRGAQERGLPLVNAHETPIRFFGLGTPEGATELGTRLMDDGIFASVAPFPVVPRKQSGVRVTLTRGHGFDDLDRILDRLAVHVPVLLEETGVDRTILERTFGMTPRPPASGSRHAPHRTSVATGLRLESAVRVRDLDVDEWDRALAGRGHFSSTGLALLERVFAGADAPEDRWSFHYYAVRDASDRLVGAAHFTGALWKDDMLAPVEISRMVEQHRARDPHYLTTRVFSAGNLLSQGAHHFLDRDADWRGALSLLLDAARADAQKADAPLLAFRDVPADDEELRHELSASGFVEIPAPCAMRLDLDWRTREEYLDRLSRRTRRYLETSVLAFEDRYAVESLGAGHRRPSDVELEHMRVLYERVRSRNLALNTFALPRAFFERVATDPAWEIYAIRLTDVDAPLPQAFGICHRRGAQYVPLVLGMDDRFVHSHGLYYRALLEAVWRGHAAGARTIEFGLAAETAKRRLGAYPTASSVFIQTDDRFHSDVLEWMAVGAKAARKP